MQRGKGILQSPALHSSLLLELLITSMYKLDCVRETKFRVHGAPKPHFTKETRAEINNAPFPHREIEGADLNEMLALPLINSTCKGIVRPVDMQLTFKAQHTRPRTVNSEYKKTQWCPLELCNRVAMKHTMPLFT